MIDLIVGVPGSGKTYFAVSKLYDLITVKDKKYKNIFTNINGLDLEKCNKLAGVENYVQSFEFEDLKKHIETEFIYHNESKSITNLAPKPLDFTFRDDDTVAGYTEHGRNDYNLKKQAYETQLQLYNSASETKNRNLKEHYDDFVKSKGVYKLYSGSLIIIDECHLYFEDREDKTLIRFLSYHRHFDIDLYLVTQNKNLINKKYLSFIETMFVAFPASKRFFSKSFRYKKYASYQEYHSNVIGNMSLKLTEKIFTLYSSGSNVLSKSILSKMLAPIIVIFILGFVGFYMIYTSMMPDEPVKPIRNLPLDHNITQNNLSINTINDDEPQKKTVNKSFFVVDCFSNSCTFKQVDMTFTKKSMFSIIDRFTCDVVVNNVVDVNYYTYILECDNSLNQVLEIFNKKQFGVKNEKNNRSTSPASNIFNR